MRTRTLTVLIAVGCLAVLLTPARADAQRRGPHYRPYYRPYHASVYMGFAGPFLYSPWGYFPFGYYQRYPYYFGGPVATGVRIQVEPKTAGVYVDGVYAGVVDDFDGYFQRLVVSPGGHEVTIHQKGYHSIVRKLYAQPRTTTNIKAKMEPLAPGEPDDPLPQAAPQPQPQAPDRYWPPQTDRPEQPVQPPRPVEPWRPVDPMRPVEPYRPGEPAVPGAAGYGQLALRWQPADATALIDGEPWQSSAGGERLTLHLAAGLHRVEIQKEGFLPFSTEVQVRAGDTTVLNVSLTERR